MELSLELRKSIPIPWAGAFNPTPELSPCAILINKEKTVLFLSREAYLIKSFSNGSFLQAIQVVT